MTNELCPRCGVVRNVILSISQNKLTDVSGKTVTVITNNYHCEVCHSFVRSEVEKVTNLQ